jgi:hypothetical protein
MSERSERNPFNKSEKPVSLLKHPKKLNPIHLSREQNAREALLDAEVADRFGREHSLPQMEHLPDGTWQLHIAGKPEGAESEGIALNEGQPNEIENIQRELDNPHKYWRSPQNNPQEK